MEGHAPISDDRDLIARARGGDQEAFRLLVERHSERLFRLAARITGDAASADDVVQETFLRAYRHLDRFDGRSAVGTWLHRIAANCALDHLRRQKRESSRLAPEESTDVVATLESVDPGPDRRLASGEIGHRVRHALTALTPMERTAFLLRHVEQCSIHDITETLGVDRGACRQAVFRAVAKLRRSLDPLRETRHA